MAYAGSIVIKVNLEDKDFNKQLTSLNQKIEKLKFDKIIEMGKAINKCKNGLNAMVKNLKTFKSLRVDSKKFEDLADSIKTIKGYSSGLVKVFKEITDCVNSLNVSNIKSIASALKTISSLNFNNIDSVERKLTKVFSGIPNNIKGGFSIEELVDFNSFIEGGKDIPKFYSEFSSVFSNINNKIRGGLDIAQLTSLNSDFASVFSGIPNNIKGGLDISQLTSLNSNIQGAINLPSITSKWQQFLNAFSNIKQKIFSIIAGLASFIGKSMQTISKYFAKGLKNIVNFSKKIANTVSQMRSKVISNLKKLGTSFRSFMYALGVDFSFAGLVRGIKEAIEEMSSLQSATLSLTSMLKAVGIESEIANEFINRFAEDGMVSLQSAMTQYKNLALRGFNSEQIERLMTIAKDFAVVNRKSGVTLESALENLTEGIKLDMSRLMDASGLSKNLSKIYSDYADKIGVYVSKLNESQKRLAILDYFEEMNKYSEGNAAKMASTFVGTVSKLKVQLKYLFAEIGRTIGWVLKPVLEEVTQLFAKWRVLVAKLNDDINNFVFNFNSKLSEMFGITNEDMDIITGTKNQLEGIQDITSDKNMSAGVNDLTDNLEEAGDAAEKLLAPFDTISQLKFKDTAAEGIEEELEGLKEVTAEKDVKKNIYWLDYFQLAVKNYIKNLGLDFSNLKDSFNSLLSTIGLGSTEQVGENILKGIENFVLSDDVKNAINFVVSELLPRLVTTIDEVIKAFKRAFEGEDFEELKKAWSDFWSVFWGEDGEKFTERAVMLTEDFIAPFVKWFLTWALPKILVLSKEITEFVDKNGPIISEIIGEIWDAVEPFVTWIFDKLIEKLEKFNELSEEERKELLKKATNWALLGTTMLIFLPILFKVIGGVSKLIHFFKDTGVATICIGWIKKIGTWFSTKAIPWISTTALPKLTNIIIGGLNTLGGKILGVIGGFLFGEKMGELLGNWVLSWGEAGELILKIYYDLTKDFYEPMETFFNWVKEEINEIIEAFKGMQEYRDKLHEKGKITPVDEMKLHNFSAVPTYKLFYDVNNNREPKYATGTSIPKNSEQYELERTSFRNQMQNDILAFNNSLNLKGQQVGSNNGTVIHNVLKLDGQVLYTSNNTISRQRGTLMINR